MLDQLTSWLGGDGAENLIASHFGFTAPFPTYVCLALIAAAAVLVPLWYWRKLAGIGAGARSFLVVLRTAVVVILVFLVLDPAIVAKRVKPGEQFVLLLFDDSQSMRIVGPDGKSRGDRLQERYAASRDEFERVLSRKHQVARYRLGAGIEPLQEMEALEFDQRESDLTGSVQSALTDMQGTTISAVVLFSDGVQQSSEETIRLSDLPESPPVFTVGVDKRSNWRDIEIGRLSVRRTDFDKSPVVLTADVHSTGLAGRRANVEVALGARVVKSREIEITEDPQTHEVRLEFVPDRPGWLDYEARVSLVEQRNVAPAADTEQVPEDRIVENNVRHFVVDNRKKTYRILYTSGRPNWENKFFRRAMMGDEQLKLTSLILISDAERKFVFRGKDSTMSNPLFEGFEQEEDRPRYDEAVFLRMGASEKELIEGYPASPEELFDYDLIIWGDVERNFFTTKQMERTRDFVEKRGGTLLMLGGPSSFTEGDYAGSIIENMLPVMLHESSGAGANLRLSEQFNVSPTVEGELSGSWLFDTDPQASEKLWNEMPPLYGLDLFPLIRPGATVMAKTVSKESGERPKPVFALQRYGEGKTAVFATSDTWQWQMRLDTDDQRHERFWRQVVRNLVSEVPGSTFLRGKQDAYTQGSPAELEFILRDDKFERREGLQTTVMLTSPNERKSPLPVEESIQETGLYTSNFVPEEDGLYHISLTALNDKDEVIATLEDTLLVEPDKRELQLAQYDPDFLESLSSRTGGALYELDGLPNLAQSIPTPVQRDAEVVLLHLWHLPIFYFLLVTMLAIEWYVRRRRGRA